MPGDSCTTTTGSEFCDDGIGWSDCSPPARKYDSQELLLGLHAMGVFLTENCGFKSKVLAVASVQYDMLLPTEAKVGATNEPLNEPTPAVALNVVPVL